MWQARLATIKLLLQHHAGFGVTQLPQLLKDKNLTPPANEFSGVNVMASGITVNDPGFETAICTYKDFVDNINVVNFSEEELKQLQKVCQKRLYEFSLQQSPLTHELNDFIKFIDLNAPNALQRLCYRYIANNKMLVDIKTSEKVKATGKLIQLPSDLMEKLSDEIKQRKIALNFNGIKQLQSFLKELKADLQKDPELISHVTSYQRAEVTRNVSLALSVFLVSAGLGYFVINNFLKFGICTEQQIQRREDGCEQDIQITHSGGMPLIAYGMLGAIPTLLALVLFISLQFFCKKEIGCGCLRTNSDDLPLLLKDCSQELLNKKGNTQTVLGHLVKEGLIKSELSDNFANAQNTSELIPAIKALKDECKNVLNQKAEDTNLFYRLETKAQFFPNQIKAAADEKFVALVVEDDSMDEDLAVDLENVDENDHLLTPNRRTYGTADSYV